MNGFKLKRYIPAIMVGMLTLVVAPGCVATYDDVVPEKTDKDNGELTVTVEAHDFDTVDPKTRAVQNGAVMKFENGDALGLTFLDASGNIVANSDNVKYTYDASAQAWATTGSPDFSKVARYIAYFPYSASCSGCKKESEVLAKLPIIANQADKPNYQASDVLFAEDAFTGNNIKIKFKHSRVCISFMARSHVQGAGYNGYLNLTDKLSRLDLYSGSTYMGCPTFFYYRDGVYYGIIEPQTNAQLYVNISFFFGQVDYEEEDVRNFKLTSSGRWDYEKGYRYHNIIDYTVNKGKLLPEMVKEGDLVVQPYESNEFTVVPVSLINYDTYIRQNESHIRGKVAKISGTVITSASFTHEMNMYYKTFGYEYTGRWLLVYNNSLDDKLWTSYDPKNFLALPQYDLPEGTGDFDITQFDGRSGRDITKEVMQKLSTQVSNWGGDDSRIPGYNKMIEVRNSLRSITNLNTYGDIANAVYFAGDKEIRYSYVGGYAPLMVKFKPPTGRYPFLPTTGGNGSLNLRGVGDPNNSSHTFKILVDFILQ